MIEELPELPFRLIFKELNYEDRFNLRRTCKTLKSLVDEQVYRNLFVFLDSYPCHKYLFHTDELVHYADSCRVPDFDRFISSKCKENFRLIRKLTIFFEGLYKLEDYLNKIDRNLKRLDEDDFFQEVWLLEIDLEHLNYFEQLEHLEIKVSQTSSGLFHPISSSLQPLFTHPGSRQSLWPASSEELEDLLD